MNTKHTPGPWNYAHGSTDLLTHDGDDVAYVDTAIPERSKAEQQANARLIAAAPELLNWLVELVGQVSTLSADAKAQISSMTLAQARAAIAKATGTTNL